jgi:hypothetical protein
MNEEMLNDEVCEKEYEEMKELDNFVDMLGEFINYDELCESRKNRAEHLLAGYDIYPDCWFWGGDFDSWIEEIPKDWCYERGVQSYLIDKWECFLKEFLNNNIPDWEKVYDTFKRIGYDRDDILGFLCATYKGGDTWEHERLEEALREANLFTPELFKFLIKFRTNIRKRKRLKVNDGIEEGYWGEPHWYYKK